MHTIGTLLPDFSFRALPMLPYTISGVVLRLRIVLETAQGVRFHQMAVSSAMQANVPGKRTAKLKAADIVIPDKLYFRIGEVADLCHLPAYVLRFWETEFPHLKPTKSGAGQRMYRRKDVESVLRIKKLLYEEGFTIAGARQQLRADGKTDKKQAPLPFPDRPSHDLKHIRQGLRDILALLSVRRP